MNLHLPKTLNHGWWRIGWHLFQGPGTWLKHSRRWYVQLQWAVSVLDERCVHQETLCAPAATIVKKIEDCKDLRSLCLSGNTVGVEAAKAIANALRTKKTLKVGNFCPFLNIWSVLTLSLGKDKEKSVSIELICRFNLKTDSHKTQVAFVQLVSTDNVTLVFWRSLQEKKEEKGRLHTRQTVHVVVVFRCL